MFGGLLQTMQNYGSLKKMFRKDGDMRTANKDSNGNMITDPVVIKELYINTYMERLEERSMMPQYEDYKGRVH